MITPFFRLDCFIYKQILKTMNSFKENFRIAKFLASLFTHSAIPEEEKAYREWINENPEHQKLAKRILNEETYEKNTQLIKSFSSQKAWDRIYPRLGGEKASGFLSWRKSLKYAALILLLIIPASYLIYNWVAGETISDITPGTLGGELILSDGKSFNLSDNNLPENAVRAFVIDSKGINYQIPANKPQVKEIPNTLRTLQGMECLITLSDGTRVHLNAETRLTYPVCFSSKERIVQIEGEAYFDVAPDKEHPFIVKTSHTSVRVTGTSFNVRAYADEDTESTTLISGTVRINSGNEEFELVPNQHYTYNKNTGTNTVANVNTDLYTSWESGSFIFLNVPLENVMSYLSKWYGFQYSFEDEAAKQVRIGAYLNRYANMNPIIDMITELNLVNIKQREGILHISYKQ